MDTKKDKLIFIALLATIDNLTKSKLDKEEVLILKCFFLLLRKESVVNDSISFDSAKVAKSTLDSLILNNTDSRIVELYEKYIKQIIDKSYSKYIFDLVGPFARLSDDFINQYASEFIDNFLSGFLNRASDYASMQPKELTTLMNHFLTQKDYKSYYNPFAGVSSLATDLPEEINFYGEEINEFVWLLGQIRILIQNPNLNYSVENRDSVFDARQSIKFDFIAFNPPTLLKLDFVKLNALQNEFVYNKNNTHGFIIRENLKRLNNNGRIVFLITSWFLSNEEDKGIREFLVKNNFLEYVISLPENILSYSRVKTNLIILSSNSEKPEQVKFIDGNELSIKEDNEHNLIDVESILSILEMPTDNELLKVVDNKEIGDNDYNLKLSLYFYNLPKLGVNESYLPLKSIVELSHAKSLRNKSNTYALIRGKIIEIPDFFNHFENFGNSIKTKDLKEFRMEEDFEGDEFSPPVWTGKVDSSCILICGLSLENSIYFQYDNEPLYIYDSGLVHIFKVDESIVDYQYLLNELHSDYVKEQFENIFEEFVTDRLSDFLGIKIRIPSMEIQKARVEGVRHCKLLANKELAKLKKEAKKLKQEAYDDAASARHNCRNYLMALQSHALATKNFINKRNGQKIALSDIYSIKENQTFGDHLKSQESLIKSISKLLGEKKETRGENVELLNLIELTKKAHQRFKQNRFEFEFRIDEPTFNQGNKEIEPLIDIDEDDFLKLYANIVQNAVDHGFKNRNDNIIHAYISYDSEKQLCILEVSNNGNPIPEKFSLKHLTTRGEKTTDSAGTGIGGADIKDIVSVYDGTLELIKDNMSTFPVTYQISFPMSKNNI